MNSQAGAARQHSLDYQAELLEQLESMARSDGFESLAYLIGMAREEAAQLLRSPARRGASRHAGGKRETVPPA